MKSNNQKKKKKKNPIRTFLSVFLSIVLSFCIIAGTATFVYYKYFDDTDFTSEDANKNSGAAFISALTGRGIKTNVAVFGVDKDGFRTDVIFVVHFDSKEKQVNLVSVPRDTRVTMTSSMKEELDKIGKWYPTQCKINEVHAYAPKDRRSEFSVMQLENLLGVSIDHYVKVDLDAFKYIVDSIGGVEMYVPRDMYWDMRDTGDPLINLKEGMQTLDGDKAEQLVRFRRYVNGDVDRVEVQQAFLKAFAEKVLSTDTIKNNLPSLIKAAYEYVETDVTVLDAIKYAQYIDDVDINKIQMETVPGVGKNIGGVSYYVHDEAGTSDLVDRFFFNKDPNVVSADSREYKIEVINGGDIKGLAGKKQEMLVSEGFNVLRVSNYLGEKTDNTRIVVQKEGMGEDLKKYFTNAEIEVNPDILTSGTEINIILGLNES